MLLIKVGVNLTGFINQTCYINLYFHLINLEYLMRNIYGEVNMQELFDDPEKVYHELQAKTEKSASTYFMYAFLGLKA